MGPLKAAGPDPKLHLCGQRTEYFLGMPAFATLGQQIPRDTYIPTLRGQRFQVVHRQTSFRAWWLTI
jgi:hypothetical protein